MCIWVVFEIMLHTVFMYLRSVFLTYGAVMVLKLVCVHCFCMFVVIHINMCSMFVLIFAFVFVLW